MPLVVGSFGDAGSLARASATDLGNDCDLAEIRLDLLDPDEIAARPWAGLEKFPLLFTARRGSEGGRGDLSAEERIARLSGVLDEASLVDIELASIPEMAPMIDELRARNLPWLASFHDFHGVPATGELRAGREAARAAGASAYKAAVHLGWEPDSLPALGLFLRESGDFPVSLMGMGPLAPVSWVFLAQLGSVLNYGYVGQTPTAPGQWSARQLKQAIGAVEKERRG